jgi:ABC-type nitrate/sulfonate/bicarbonate transport system substrate-binding protein
MRLRPRYRVALTAALIGIAAALQGIGAGQAHAEEVTIRYLRYHGSVTAYEIAEAKGWLKEKGIKLSAEGYAQGGPESLVAVVSGSIDVGGAATTAIINAIANGAKIIGVGPNSGVSKTVNSKFYVLADSPLKTPQDLKGKSIAVNTLGAHLDYTIREYLRKHDLKKDDVKLVVVPGPQLEQVLRHKQSDVVAVGAWQAVFGGKIEAGGGTRVVFTDYDVLGDIVLGTNAMTRAFVDRHPQAVRDFVTASAQATDWATEHPDEAKKLFAEILATRGENQALAGYFPGFGLREHALYTDHDAQFWIDALVRGGKLKPGQFTPKDIETNKYNEFAARRAQQ